jgi:drug/metabolite transporter (DMT)-like permease
MALVSAWAESSNFVACKVLFENRSTRSTELINLYQGFGGFLVSLVSSIIDQKSQLISQEIVLISLESWAGMMATAISCNIAVASTNFALIYTGPVLVSFVRVFVIIVAYFIQVIFFNQVPLMVSIVGSVCVVVAVIILPIEQLARKIPPHCLYDII